MTILIRSDVSSSSSPLEISRLEISTLDKLYATKTSSALDEDEQENLVRLDRREPLFFDEEKVLHFLLKCTS